MTTIADIQAKFVHKLSEKLPSRSSMNPRSVSKVLSEYDTNNDGFLTLKEFKRSVERCGNALNEKEAELLFAFWDSCAGQREQCGQVEVKLAVQDIMNSVPEFRGQFNSGDDAGARYGSNKSNAPSQSGGIFGGGSYEADARGEAMPSYRGPAMGAPVHEPFSEQVPTRPRGNQSSVQGGIFNQEPIEAGPPSSRTGNKSNKSSVEGGIFGEQAAPQPCAPTKRFNSNASSVKGGIFG